MPDIEEILASLSEKEEKRFKYKYETAFIEMQKMFAENIGYNRCLNDIQERFHQEIEKEKG